MGGNGDTSSSNFLQQKLTSGDTKSNLTTLWKRSAIKANTAHISIGRNEFLPLHEVRVIVKVEGLRVRTIVDHIFFNPHKRQLQGTFRYQLPDDSSICYFAFSPGLQNGNPVVVGDASVSLPKLPKAHTVYQMSVEDIIQKEQSAFGAPQIARIVPKQKALAAYEGVVRRGVDPALVEWAGGNTFSARVFPLLAKNYQRVVIAYEQTLPKWEKKCHYQFFFPKNVDTDFLLVATASYAKKQQFNLGKPYKSTKEWTAYRFFGQANHASYSFVAPDEEFIVGTEPKGPMYLYGRISPPLPSMASKTNSKEAVFLLDTSLSQESYEFNIAIKLLERILKHNLSIKKFNILFFNVETSWMKKDGWIENTQMQRKKLLSTLDNILLEGATDIESLLMSLNSSSWLNKPGKKIDIFLLSNGQSTWGDLDALRTVTRFKKKLRFTPHFYCYNLGNAGLGNANQELFQLLQCFGGSTFSYNSGLSLDKLAVAHQKQSFFVTEIISSGLDDLLIAGDISSIYPGQGILLAAKITKEKPQITIKGTFQGQPKQFTYSIPLSFKGHLAPRAFGELAVKKMESMNNSNLKKTIIAFARHFSVPGKTCSLLMLESPDDYKQFQIDLSESTPSVRNSKIKPLLKTASLQASAQSAKNKFSKFWRLLQQNNLVPLKATDTIETLLALLSEKDFIVPKEKITCLLYSASQVPGYLKARKQNRKAYQLYLKEGERRYIKNWKNDYFRCLSSIVELEPENSTALRMVGYHLLHKQMSVQTVALFQRIRDKRSFEPQSYRDLAKCYAGIGKYGVAALYYEIVLAGKWHKRFGQIQKVIKDEYIRMLRQILRKKTKHSHFFSNRLGQLATSSNQADIVVTMIWNTSDTDVDLWVGEPGGEECGYSHKTTKSGGQLLEDITTGYGPERYHLTKAPSGKYTIKVQYFSANSTLLSDITFVEILVTTRAGYKDEKTRSFWKMLTSAQQKVSVYEFHKEN